MHSAATYYNSFKKEKRKILIMSVTNQKAHEIFENHPTRFTKKEKAALRNTLRKELIKSGYSDDDITEINASGTNLLVGDPHAEYMFTAHYDTPGRTGCRELGRPSDDQTFHQLCSNDL